MSDSGFTSRKEFQREHPEAETFEPWEWQCIWALAISEVTEVVDLGAAVPLAVEIWISQREDLQGGFNSAGNSASVTLHCDGSASVIYRSSDSSPND